MEDEEVVALKNLRNKLLIKACDLIEKLKKQETDEQKSVTLRVSDIVKDTSNREEKLEQDEHKLCEVSQQISGITFKNINRKWLSDDYYQYIALVVTKALEFHVELSVKLKKKTEFEICDINCHFININECYMLEIEPWIQNITRMKNFSLLISAISQYSEQSILRAKIVDKLKIGKYASDEQCTDKNGGILLYIHAPDNIEQVYLKFHWSILFIEQTWQLEHYFVIHPEETGLKFAEKNRNLLEKFCKICLTKENLIDLWSKLCSAVDSYEDRNTSEVDYNSE